MHVLGLWSVSLSLITGGAALLVDRWEPRRIVRLLAETGMEQVILVPSFLGELLAVVREDGIRLPRLREITVGGTAVLPEPVTETAEVLGLPLLAQWGMTEGGLILTSPEDPPDWAARSIGRPGIGTEAELRRVAAEAPRHAHRAIGGSSLPALPAGDLASPRRPVRQKVLTSPAAGSASRGGRDERSSSRTAARLEPARWPAPRTSRSLRPYHSRVPAAVLAPRAGGL